MNVYQASAAKRRLQMKTTQVAKLFNFKPKSVTSLAILLFFVVGAFYIVMINLVSTKGLSLRATETQNTDLEGENQRLEVEAARLKSLKVINESATGEVQVGNGVDGAPAGQPTTTSPTTTKDANPIANQPVTFVPSGSLAVQSSAAEGGVIDIKPKPKLVPMAHQAYLPSYNTSLASK